MYTTKQAMIDRFGVNELIDLTDRANPPVGVIDDVVLDSAIAAATSEINGYVQSRYALPMPSVPELIAELALHMARYHLYDDAPTEHVRQRYNDAITKLKDVSKGIIHLGLDSNGATTAPANIPVMSGPAKVFGRDNLRGY